MAIIPRLSPLWQRLQRTVERRLITPFSAIAVARPLPPPTRSLASLQAHYTVERELADRLRTTPREERGARYAALYDELFQRVPDHPQLLQKRSAAARAQLVARQVGWLRHFLAGGESFLEIGSGDGALSSAMAPFASQVYALEVSSQIVEGVELPQNVSLILSDGCSVPVEPGSVAVAFSDQVMEHLHPEDARAQLEEIYRALAPGGRYICVTPNRTSGPHDISKYFDAEARGFHLKEYTLDELAALFRASGFRELRTYVVLRGRAHLYPLGPFLLLERLLRALPRVLGRPLARWSPFHGLLGIRLIGQRPESPPPS